MGIAGESWLLLALLAMACFSLSTILLKVIVSDYGLPNLWRELTRPSLSTPVQYAIGVFLLSLVGFAAFLMALEQGKVALVNAVVSLSTVLIALLSYAFLGDRFALKEIAALALALASIVVLAL